MDSSRQIVIHAVLLGGVFMVCMGQETKSFDIVTTIQNRFAETTISSEVLNDEDVDKEIGFHVMLPKEAFITYFDMTINGTKYEGDIEEKRKAEKIFEEAKERGRTAGIVRTEKNTNNVFKTSVNIAARESVTFTLIYQQLLRKLNGKFRNSIILLGNSLDESVTPNIDVYICESQTITNITVPETLSSDEGSYEYDVAISVKGNWGHVEFLNIDLDTRYKTPVEDDDDDDDDDEDDVAGNFTNNTYSSSYGNETESPGSGSFVIEYELKQADEGGQIVVDEGYLVHFFAPVIKKPFRRFAFVLDISGSMVGRKLQQMTDAMINILGKFSKEDRIGLIKFTSTSFTWLDGNMTYATPNMTRSATKFLKFGHYNGGTEIWLGLEKALNMLIKDVGDTDINAENNMIVLLTDGLGSLTTSELLNNVETLGGKRFAIHTIGFGDGVDADLLKALSANNHGSWKQILETFDAQLQIENYMDELGLALLSGIKFEYPEIVEETVKAKEKYMYGSEIMAVSRLNKDAKLSKNEPHSVKITGYSPEEIVVEAQFHLDQNARQCESFLGKSVEDFGKKVFGMIKVEEALRLYDAEGNSTVKEILKEKAINMSLLYKLVTPVTSMLVVKPEDRAELEQAIEEQEIIEATQPPPPVYGTGGGGWHRQAPGYSGYGDPHFVVKLSSDINVCFNWPLHGQRVVNLLYDEKHRIIINALLMSGSNEEDGKATKQHGLFIRESVIILENEDIEIAIDEERASVININEARKQDTDLLYLPLRSIARYNASYENIHFTVTVKEKCRTLLLIIINGNIRIKVDVHQYCLESNMSRSHLDISLADSGGLSNNLRGFFGSLHVNKEMQKSEIRIQENENKQMKEMTHLLIFKGRKVPVRREKKKLPHYNGTFDCWWINDVDKLLGSPLETFDQKSLFEIPK